MYNFSAKWSLSSKSSSVRRIYDIFCVGAKEMGGKNMIWSDLKRQLTVRVAVTNAQESRFKRGSILPWAGKEIISLRTRVTQAKSVIFSKKTSVTQSICQVSRRGLNIVSTEAQASATPEWIYDTLCSNLHRWRFWSKNKSFSLLWIFHCFLFDRNDSKWKTPHILTSKNWGVTLTRQSQERWDSLAIQNKKKSVAASLRPLYALFHWQKLFLPLLLEPFYLDISPAEHR